MTQCLAIRAGPQNQHSVRYTHFVDVFRSTNFHQNQHSVQLTHFVDEPIFQSTNPINILYNKPILFMYSDKTSSTKINILRKISILLMIKTLKRLGDILPQGQNAPRQNAPWTFCPRTFCPKSHKLFEGGHIAPNCRIMVDIFAPLLSDFERLLRNF